MSFQCVAVDTVAPQAWRNGGGQTRELLAWPDPAGWSVRISLADIESDGPFSGFPGVQRWFAVVQGAGVRLRFGPATQALSQTDEPLCFDGALAPGCALVDGPTRDLNLMLRGTSGQMRRVRAGLQRDVLSPCLVAVYAVSAPARIQFGAQTAQTVPARTLAWRVTATPGSVRLEADDALWLEARA